MATKFAGKIAVITGGSTGIGLAAASRFVQEGVDHVFIAGRRKDALDAAVAEIGKNGTAVQGDVASLLDLDRLYDAVKKQHRPIDIIFANAGVAKLARSAPWMRNFSTFTSTQMSEDSSSPCRKASL